MELLFAAIAEKLDFPLDQVSLFVLVLIIDSQTYSLCVCMCNTVSTSHSVTVSSTHCHLLTQTDQVRYLVLIFLSYPLAYIFRYVLHPSHTSLTTRYVYSMSLGLVMGFMCFGWQMFILFGVVGVSYIFLLVLPPNVVQRYRKTTCCTSCFSTNYVSHHVVLFIQPSSYTMVWALGCVSAAHVYRMITDYEGWHLDFTG